MKFDRDPTALIEAIARPASGETLIGLIEHLSGDEELDELVAEIASAELEDR